MLSKHVTKVVQNLEKKKFREKYNLFKIEGEKLVKELILSNLNVHTVLAYPAWLDANPYIAERERCTEVSPEEMKSISNFQSLPEAIALAEIPKRTYQEKEIRESLSLILNGIQDPGNMGTILRVADWFGIKNIFCDDDSASVYNPKCVQASMGAVFRVNVFYSDLTEVIKKFSSETFHCYGTFLDGENLYRQELDNKGFIIMGNEGKGISPNIEQLVDSRITIPSFAIGSHSTESLNVGVATGVILSEFCRKQAAR